jgi:hypothetical protein
MVVQSDHWRLPHSTIACQFFFSGNETQVYNIARTALKQERQAFPQTMARDWTIDISEPKFLYDGNIVRQLTVRLKNHPEITWFMLEPLNMNIRNTLAPFIIKVHEQ